MQRFEQLVSLVRRLERYCSIDVGDGRFSKLQYTVVVQYVCRRGLIQFEPTQARMSNFESIFTFHVDRISIFELFISAPGFLGVSQQGGKGKPPIKRKSKQKAGKPPVRKTLSQEILYCTSIVQSSSQQLVLRVIQLALRT